MEKVFISSVISGFEDYRDIAKKAVTLIGMKAILVEELPSSPKSSQQMCFDEIRKADFFVLILGEKYGSITEQGISVTEEEYNEAQSLGKPILVFIQNVKMEPKQEAFKKRVEKYECGHFRATFSEREKLKEEIIKSLSNLGDKTDKKKFENKEERINEMLVERTSEKERILLRFMLKKGKQSVFFSPRKISSAVKTPLGVKYFNIVKKGERKRRLDMNSSYFESSEFIGVEWLKDREGLNIKIYDSAWKYLEKNRKEILNKWDKDRENLPPKIPVQTSYNSKTKRLEMKWNLPDELEDKIYESFLEQLIY